MMEMVEPYISWRKERGHMSCFLGGITGSIWTYGRRRFWWSPFTRTKSKISTIVSARIWEVRQSSSGVNSKGVGGDLYERIKTRDCWRHSDNQTTNTERSYHPCEDEGWIAGSTIKIHMTTPNQPSATKSSRSSWHQTSLPSQTHIVGRNAEKTNHRVVLNCNDKFTTDHKCWGP